MAMYFFTQATYKNVLQNLILLATAYQCLVEKPLGWIKMQIDLGQPGSGTKTNWPSFPPELLEIPKK